MRFPLSASQPTHDILRFVLRGHMIDVYEMVRFPAIRAYLTTSLPPSSPSNVHVRNLSPACLRLAKEALANAVYRIETNAEGLLHRHQGTWLTVRSCTRSALVLLGAAIKVRISIRSGRGSEDGDGGGVEGEMLPERWREAVVRVLEMLRVWARESAHIERLRCVVERLVELV